MYMHYTIDEELSARILQFEKYIKAKKALVRQMFPYSPVLRKNFSSLLDTLLDESRRGNIFVPLAEFMIMRGRMSRRGNRQEWRG